MKRPATILAIAILAVVVLVACASTIRTGKTSIVTITIGGASGTALLKAEAATPWARFKYYLADVKLMPEAYAYIPSIVQAIIVTVTAPDMPTPIVGVSSLTSTQTLAEIRIEVPNGAARTFLVEGYRGVDSKVYFSGTATRDLDGTDVSLPISMSFTGTGIYVDPTKPLSANTPTCGSTPAAACATITHVLNTRPSTTNNDVIVALPGNYIFSLAASIETFPLQLKPGMALLCQGTGTVPTYSSVIDVSNTIATAIRGNAAASIDNCKIKIGFGSNGINDQGTKTKINGVYIELTGSGTSPDTVGAILSNDSAILESTITGSGLISGPIFGVQVNGGKPDIIGNTIAFLPTGISLTAGAGDANITSNVLDSNSMGITIASTGSPKISLNRIAFGSSTGILVNAGSPAITGNNINNNSIGLDIEFNAVSPLIQSNSLYCNSQADFFTNLSTQLNIRGNAWDNDLVTNPTSTDGPTEMTSPNGAGGCGGGSDICYQDTSPRPDFSTILSAVPNGCAVGVGKPAQ